MLSLARNSGSSTICLHSLRRFHISVTRYEKATPKAKNSGAKKLKKADKPEPDEMKPTEYPSGIPFHRSRIEAFLEELDASEATGPSLEDLKSMKPSQPAGPGSPTYPEEYENALKRIQRAFKVTQTTEFMNKIAYEGKLPATHREMAQVLIDKSWDWPPPHELERRQRESVEKITEDIPVSTATLLLLMAEDPHSFSVLGTKFGLRLSLGQSQEPVILAYGLRNGISELRKYLQLKSQQTVSRSIDIRPGQSISPSLVQMAIRKAKTYAEILPPQTLELTAFTDDALQKAERLIRRLLYLEDHELAIPLIAQIPPPINNEDSPELAYYPFLPGKNIPHILEKRRLFRLKRVATWLDGYDERESSPFGHSFLDLKGTKLEIDDCVAILGGPPLEGHARSWTASFGHLLFDTSTPTITSPYPGSWSIKSILKQIQTTNWNAHFVPSQPSLLFTNVPTTITTAHRVIYRPAQPKDSRPVRQISSEAAESRIFILEVKMEYDTGLKELDDLDGHDTSAEKIAILPLHGSHRCRTGVEASVDALLPEKAMDMRLTVRDLRGIYESDEPESIKSYLEQLLQFLQYQVDEQPAAPEKIQYNGETYILESSSSVRRAYETIAQESNKWGTGDISSFEDVYIVAETALNLDSQEKTSHCFIETSDCDPKNWEAFLTHSAAIASIPFTPQGGDRGFQTPVFSE